MSALRTGFNFSHDLLADATEVVIPRPLPLFLLFVPLPMFAYGGVRFGHPLWNLRRFAIPEGVMILPCFDHDSLTRRPGWLELIADLTYEHSPCLCRLPGRQTPG